MSRNNHRNVEDLYAVVDLSKKKKRKEREASKPQDLETDVPTYAVVDKETSFDPEDKINSERNTLNQSVSSHDTSSWKQSGSILLGVAAAMVLTTIIIMFVILFVKVAALEGTNISFNEEENLQAINTTLQKFIQENHQKCENYLSYSINQLSEIYNDKLNDSINVLSEIYKDELMSVNKSLDSLSNDVRRYISAGLDIYGTSCSDINKKGEASGNYILKTPSGVLRSVYCDMTRNCGGVSGGWMRVARLNTNDCPPGFHSMGINNSLSCVVTEEEPGCTSIIYPTFNIPFSKVCGKIIGYPGGTLDGFFGLQASYRSQNLSENYLDGVSVTSDNQHIWSFVAGDCTCNDSRKPSFVDTDWTCDARMPCSEGSFCTPHLWSSQQCGSPSASWFFKNLTNSTSEIKVRVCRNEPKDNEDLAITRLELYVQ